MGWVQFHLDIYPIDFYPFDFCTRHLHYVWAPLLSPLQPSAAHLFFRLVFSRSRSIIPPCSVRLCLCRTFCLPLSSSCVMVVRCDAIYPTYCVAIAPPDACTSVSKHSSVWLECPSIKKTLLMGFSTCMDVNARVYQSWWAIRMRSHDIICSYFPCFCVMNVFKMNKAGLTP